LPLDDGDVRRLRSLLTLTRLVLELRAFGERLEAIAGDVRVVDEEILVAFVRADEAVALRVVEPLDGSGCHENTSLPCTDERVRRDCLRYRSWFSSTSVAVETATGCRAAPARARSPRRAP